MENNNLNGNTAPEGANPQTQNEQLTKLQNALMSCESLVVSALDLIHHEMDKANVKPIYRQVNEKDLKSKMIDFLSEWTDDNEHDLEGKIENAVETRLVWREDYNEQSGTMEIEKEANGVWQLGYDIAENFVNDFFYQLEQEGGAQ